MTKTMTKNRIQPSNQWVALNKVLYLYKLMGVLLGFLCFSLTVFSFYLSTNPPVVVLQKGEERRFYSSEKKEIHLSEKDIARFIEEYIRLRYTWSDSNPISALQNISPLTTKGLLQKMRDQIRKDFGKEESNKKIEQTVSNIKPIVTKNQALASFDRIVRVNNIPLIAPTRLSFRIIRNNPTVWNPMGLYVDGITIHETAHEVSK